MAAVIWIWLVSQDGAATQLNVLVSVASAATALSSAEQEPAAPNLQSSPNPSASSAAEKGNIAVERLQGAVAAPSGDLSKADEAKSQSILQMLEGRETEVNIGLIVAVIAFAMGWFCGGSYYARRERKSRHKLRF